MTRPAERTAGSRLLLRGDMRTPPRQQQQMALLALLLVAAACGAATSSGSGGGDIAIIRGASTKTYTAFFPDTFTVSLGADPKVTWYNADFTTTGGYGGGTTGVSHNLQSDDAGVTFTSGLILYQHSYSATFTTPGTFDYHCQIHPGMKGTIIVNP